jgi:hypothetical protein
LSAVVRVFPWLVFVRGLEAEAVMRANRAVVTAALGLSLLAGACSGGGERVDMIAAFDQLQKKPDPALFKVADVALNNETMRAIEVAPVAGTRLIWKVRVPEDGWLHVSVGLKPEAWEKEGDGVLFMVGVSDGRAYDQLFTQHVDPYGNPADRRWIPVKVDVSAYGGEEVDVILNTVASPPKREGDLRNDLAVWGAPQLVVQ